MYSYILSSPYTKNYRGGIPEISYLLVANFQDTTNPTPQIELTQNNEKNETIDYDEVWIKADYAESPSFQALNSNLEIPLEPISVYQQPTGYSTTLTQEQKVYTVPGTDEYVLEMIGFDLYWRTSKEDREFLKIASNMFNLGDKVDIKRIFKNIRAFGDE